MTRSAEGRPVAPHLQVMISAAQTKTMKQGPAKQATTAPHVRAMIAAGQARMNRSAVKSPRSSPSATARPQPTVQAHRVSSGLVATSPSGRRNVLQPAALEKESAPFSVTVTAPLVSPLTGFAYSGPKPTSLGAMKDLHARVSIAESKLDPGSFVPQGRHRAAPKDQSLWTHGLGNCIGLLLVGNHYIALAHLDTVEATERELPQMMASVNAASGRVNAFIASGSIPTGKTEPAGYPESIAISRYIREHLHPIAIRVTGPGPNTGGFLGWFPSERRKVKIIDKADT